MFVDAVVWLRNDLRIHDHEPLSEALACTKNTVAMVYCIDPRLFDPAGLGWPKTGPYRTRFLLEALTDLRHTLRNIGSDLVILHGLPEVEIPNFAQKWGASTVFWHEEATSEERLVADTLRENLERQHTNVQTSWGSTLYHTDDLPFDPIDMPDVFTPYRKQVEKHASVRKVFRTPTRLPPLPDALDSGELPSVEALGITPSSIDERAVLGFVGGESHALARLEKYFWQDDALRHYKETRNGLLGQNYSSKFSPWLALGCISPRHIYWEVKRYEHQRVKNDSTYWLIFELIWRDFFRVLALAEGDRLFYQTGFKSRRLKWSQNEDIFWRWANGQTGVPFVDANMRELNQTGFMSNRGRQNVASFLAKHLRIDWRWGASYFESMLLDYDPCSNWGNWQYVSGVGNDPRDRVFNILRQGDRYDKQGKYIKQWVEELRDLPSTLIHAPHTYGRRELKAKYNIQLGVDYPQPLVDLTSKARQ